MDTETIERDPANAGELPVIRGTLYAEVYKDPLTYPDYGNYRMVEYIFQYETAMGADQYGREIRYRILNKLQGVYTPDGKPAVYTGVHDEPADEADDIYAAMLSSVEKLLRSGDRGAAGQIPFPFTNSVPCYIINKTSLIKQRSHETCLLASFLFMDPLQGKL